MYAFAMSSRKRILEGVRCAPADFSEQIWDRLSLSRCGQTYEVVATIRRWTKDNRFIRELLDRPVEIVRWKGWQVRAD